MRQRDLIKGIASSATAWPMPVAFITIAAIFAFAQTEQEFGFERLLLWIESQTPAIIALITFGICYACAAVIFAFARVFLPRRIADELKATTPVMLTPLAVLTGLVTHLSLLEYGSISITPIHLSGTKPVTSKKF